MTALDLPEFGDRGGGGRHPLESIGQELGEGGGDGAGGGRGGGGRGWQLLAASLPHG